MILLTFLLPMPQAQRSIFPPLAPLAQGSANVCPRAPRYHLPDVFIVCSKGSGEVGTRLARGGIPGSDLEYLSLRQTEPHLQVPEPHAPVQRVVLLGAEAKMGGIAADRSVTGVDDPQPLWNVPSGQTVRDPGRVFILGALDSSADIELTSFFSSSHEFSSHPRPAGVLAAGLIDAVPESRCK